MGGVNIVAAAVDSFSERYGFDYEWTWQLFQTLLSEFRELNKSKT
jgi:hypothetical protein